MPDLQAFQTLLATQALTIPILFSLLTGALVGLDRELQGKPAGLRTHMLVCFASTLLMLLAARQNQWALDLLPDTQMVVDLTRMPHGILTGIGFLGAGVIFREGASVQGLTTAASLWVTAALGIVYGVGQVELGILGTVVTMLVLVALRVLQLILPSRAQLRIRITLAREAALDPRALIGALQGLGLRVREHAVTLDPARDTADITLIAGLRDGPRRMPTLAQDIARLPGVTGLAISPVDGPLALT